ncbi:unnamed protein product [Adineta ricciae]|uniref:EGF-like domain-containing protein n=1 Tax=Adineta ricciae TaxID=249248 RepID=A0A813YTV0_ADIRI|nr:unnamed protein product [Adineta ricciae]CAF1433388.1 unnamed protein product [Adineta ricciae]
MNGIVILGIAVTKRFSTKIECLCSSSYYGSRCEYQSERILIIMYMDIVAIDSKYAEYRASWSYDVPFSFLPVNRLVLHLRLDDAPSCRTLKCVHGFCKRYLNSPHHVYCHCHDHWTGFRFDIANVCPCAAGGKCVDGSNSSICICPLGRFGHRREGWFDPCNDNNCKNNGTCVPVDERQNPRYTCLCPIEYEGSDCSTKLNRINLYFSSNFVLRYSLQSAAIFIYILLLNSPVKGVFAIQKRNLIDQTNLHNSLLMFYDNLKKSPLLILVQVYNERDQAEFYVVTFMKKPHDYLTVNVQSDQQCFHIDQIIENQTIREFPLIRRVKYYHHLCLLNKNMRCFIDEHYICFCDHYRQLVCGIFLQESTQCSMNHCQNNGKCIQLTFNGIWDFRCICPSCTFGSLCQLTTSEYTLSLDLILGQDILQTVPFQYQ